MWATTSVHPVKNYSGMPPIVASPLAPFRFLAYKLNWWYAMAAWPNRSDQFEPDMHVVLFDIDGTLILSGGAGQEALRLAMRREFSIADPAEVNIHGCTDRGIANSLFEAHDIAFTDENWVRFLDSYLGHLTDELAKNNGEILPGVTELLNRIHEWDHVHLGLLTGNVRRGAEIKLAHFGLLEFFPFGGFGDHSVDRNDVASQARSEVHDKIGTHIADDRIWVIGDTPNDIRCARSINARVLAVTTGGYDRHALTREQPDVVLDDLSQSAEWLESFVA